MDLQEEPPAASVPQMSSLATPPEAADVSALMEQLIRRRLEFHRRRSTQRLGAAEAAPGKRGAQEFWLAVKEVADMASRRLEQQRVELEEHFCELRVAKRVEGMPLQEMLPVMVVCFCIGIVSVSFSVVYMPLAGVKIMGAKSLMFHGSLGMFLLSYYEGMATDAGDIPANWAGAPDGQPLFMLENPTLQFQPVERKKNGEFRYCKKMKMFKPDRSHFCRQCKKGVLRMDHHCPWLLNCVGHHNYKHFFLTLLYASTATGTAAASLTPLTVHGVFGHPDPLIMSAGHTFLLAQGTVMSWTLTAAVGPLFALHCFLLSRNMTTLECFEKRQRGSSLRSPYDVGLIRNVKSVLGERPELWLLPLGVPADDGVHWERNDEAEQLLSQGEDVEAGEGEQARGSDWNAAGAASTGSWLEGAWQQTTSKLWDDLCELGSSWFSREAPVIQTVVRHGQPVVQHDRRVPRAD